MGKKFHFARLEVGHAACLDKVYLYSSIALIPSFEYETKSSRIAFHINEIQPEMHYSLLILLTTHWAHFVLQFSLWNYLFLRLKLSDSVNR